MSDWRITPLRVGIWLSLLVAFGFWGGFAPIEGDFGTHRRLTKAWLLLVVMFVGGSLSATMGDQLYGTIERSSLRILYLLGGSLAMMGALVLLHGLRVAAS